MGLLGGMHVFGLSRDIWKTSGRGGICQVVSSRDGGEFVDKLPIGMVGGGRDAFIGAVHRMVLRLDGQTELVAGCLSSDAQRAMDSAADLGISQDRAYDDYAKMAEVEAARDDGIKAVIIVTPNHLHSPIATAFLEAGIDVICDKPLSTTLHEAEHLVQLARSSGLVFAVTLNNTGYPLVRQMKEMIAEGALGALRGIHVEYIQDWLSHPIENDGQKQASWRTDPKQAGASAVLADIGVHAFNLASFVTGLQAEKVAADLTTAVPGRKLDDNANILIRWQGGIPGTLIASQTFPGHFNDLSIRIIGEKGGLEWTGTNPDALKFTPLGEETRTIIRGGPGSSAEALQISRMPASHPEGYIEAFGNFYRDAIEMIRARRSGANFPRSKWVPDVIDGARGVKFVDAAVASNTQGGQWVSALFEA